MWKICLVCCIFARVDTGWSVFNGSPVTPNSKPFMVQVHYTKKERPMIENGIIINPYTVLTKGSFRYDGAEISAVKAGKHSLDKTESTEQVRKVCNFTTPPEFKKTYKFQYGLIHLAEPFVFNEFVSAAKLAPKGYLPTGECRLIGWGASRKKEEKHSAELRESVVYFEPLQTCANVYGDFEQHETVGCLQMGGCWGDAGAAVFCSGVVYAIATSAIANNECTHTCVATLPYMSREWLVTELKNAVSKCGCN